jgi:hypothetical protein
VIFPLEIESLENDTRKQGTENQPGWSREERKAVNYACPARNAISFAAPAAFKQRESAC